MSAYEDKLEELRKKYGVSEQQEDETPGDSGGTVQGESYDSILDNLRKKYSQSFAEEIKIEDNSMPLHEVDADYINHFLDDAHTFLNTAANDWDKISWSTAMDEGASKQRDASLKDLNYRANLIGFYLDKNADALGAETTSNLQGYLDAYRADVSTLTQVYREAKNFYSQWDSEDKYLAALEQQKSYDDKINLDLDAAQKEIEELERKRDEMRVANTKQPAYSHLTGSSTMPSSPYAAGLQADAEFDKELYDLSALISQKRAYLNQAKYLQEWKTLSAVSLNEDFAKFSVRDAKNSDMVYSYINGADNGDREKMSKRQPASNYNTGNAQNTSSPYAAGHQNGGNQPLAENLKIYDYMRSDEIAIYNYHYAKDGKEAADRYLWSIKEQLNSRKATDMFEDIEGNTGLELLFGIEAGFNQFTSGLSNLFNTKDDYIPQTAYQIASGMVREDLADAGPKLPDWMGGASLGQVGYDAITTTTNMLPSILTSAEIGMINPAAGATTGTLLMGSSAAGNAYQEMLNLGYDKGQARLYSTMVGASEAGLQYLLGGVSKMGGKLSNKTLTKMLNGVDNALARTAIKLGGNMVSEGIEEGLQEILTPWFQNLVMYTDKDVNWSEVAYSSLLGMLTAGFMEGPSSISGEVNTYKTGKQLESKGFSADRLAKIGKTFSSDTVAYQLAGRVNENTGAYTIGRLFNEIGATMTEQNVNDITAALVNKGMDEATARKNAESMAVVVEGGNLTDLQVAIIESNEVLAEAVRTTIIDSNATWFQRTKGYNEVLMALAQEKAGPKASQTSPAEARKENAPALGKVDAKNENSPESDPEVDTSPSKVKSISAIQKGNATIKLDDGSEVSVRDADLSPEDGVIIETIASIAGISVEDANYIFNTLRAAPGASAQMDALGAKEAYKYGLYGFSQEHITRHGVFANSLTEAQRQAIYETGQKARQKQIEKATPKKGTVTNKETGIYFDNGNGDVVAFKDAKKTLTDKQSAGVKFAMVLKKLGIGGDIYFFESYLDSKGKRVYKDKNGKEVKAPNGWYSKDGSIHIDLKAGSKGEGFVLFTLSHELTHFIEQWSPQKYKILADFLVENYEKGQSMDKLVRAKQAMLSANRGKSVSYKEAYSEVVADSMEAMLSDANVLEKLVALKAKDNGLFMKMKQFFDNLLKKIRSIYKGQVPDSVEGRAVMEMTDSIERLQQFFAEALVDASENFRTAEKNTTVDGDVMYMSRDIASVTEDTVREDLTDIFNGINVASKSYIPLTKTTPFAVRYITRDMADRPIIVDKKKAYFDMREDGIFKEDSNHHYHGMGVDGFLEAMDILNDPGCAIEEEMKNGDIHYAFISTNEDGYEVCVAFQMSVFKPEYTMNGYPGGLYNLDITEFVATDEWMEAHGVEPGITYKDYLLSFTKNKLVYDRKFHLEQLEKAKAEELEKARNTDVGSAGLAASHINNRASGDKVTHPGTVVKTESLTPGEEGTIVNQNGDPVAHSTEDGTVQLSMRTYDEDGREAFRKYLQKCVTSKKLTKAEMQEMLDGIEEIYGICKDFKDKYAPFSSWSDAAVVRDTHGKPVFSVVTPNGDYKMNLDFSLVCKKRRTLDAVFNEMSRRGIIDDFELGQKSVVKINEIIRRNGLETACALCFVDAKRFRQDSMADQFTRLYNELVESLVPEDQKGNIDHFNFSGYATIKKVDGGIDTWDNSKLDFSHINHVLKTYGDGTVEYKAAKYIKTHAEGRKLLLRGDFMSSQGFDAVKTQNQDILKLYNSKKGTGGPKAAFGDVQYMNEVIQKARRWTPKKAYEVGGIRIQSFSDYVPRMVFDYVQMVYDLAATKLPAHAYTKEALFVKQFGLTGIKINMSLIPAIAEGGIAPGLDANGNYVWAGESFDFETAKEIQNAEGYTENCGTICVGVSYKHIVKLLSDPNIRMVIPYHKSGLNPIVAHMNKIAEFTDYTTLKTNPGGCQNTIDKNGSKVAVDFNFNEVLRKTGDPKATVRQYLDWCSKHEYTPRFAEFAWHENYYKLIEDFTLYDKDGNYVPQREVRAVFPKADSAFGSMKDLIKAGLEEDAIVEGKRDARLSSIVDEIQRTIPKTEAEIAEEQVAQADKDLEADIQLSDRDTTYLDAVNRGDMETAQRMVDEAAKMAGYDSTKLYHGTSAFGFTQIDTKKSNDRISFFATDSMQTAGTYSGTSTVRSLGDESKSSLGMYQLYANTDGMVEFDAKGAESNHIALGLAEKDYNDVMYGKVWYSFATAKRLAKYAKRKGYTGVIIKNVVDSATPQGRKTASPANVYIFFDSNQIKSADPVTYDGSGNVIPLSQRFNTEKDDIRYSDRDTESVSNRSLLANAFDGMAQNDIERNKIKEYKDKIDLINAEEKKLRELNEQIKELSFAKGPKDTKKLKELRFDANQAANRINTYDKQLLRLEASQPLQDVLAREKKLAYQRAEKKGKEALEAYRERATKTQRELMNRWQESRKKAVEGREKTAMRHKIQNVVKELNDLLLNGDKKRHVPENLKKAVADALALVNMDTVGAEERAAKYAALIAKETDPDKIDAYTVSMENILRQGEKMGQRLKELRDAYEEISESDDPDIANAYDPVIAGSLKELSQSIGNTSLRNMTIEQLSDVYDMYKMVLTRVRDANKSLIESIKESIANRASRVVGEIRRVGGEHKYRAAILDPVRKFLWNNLKPVYAFEHLGSATLTEAFNGVRKGEDTWATDVTEARGYYLDKSRKYGYDSWDFKKKYRFTSASELEFELTLEQILSLYAYSKREQAHDHLRLGGFVFDSNIETYKDDGGKLKYKVNTADAHQLTPEILANIIGTLTSEQMSFVDEMQEYLSTVMGAKGNEVTMKMYGVKLFKEKFYFPLKSAKQFMFEQNEVSGEVKIKNSGFTNKVVAKANNPVILSNFMDVWANHVNDMSMYHSFVLPLEDFNRIFNYNSPKKENQPSVSVKGTIQSAYSPAAVNYVKQLVTDLNGGAVSDPRETIGKSLMSKFKKAKVFSSLSVVIQQPSALGRAFALVNPRYFHTTKDGMKHDELWAELKKYAPVAIIKEMGYFDTNMGRSAVDFIKAKEYTTFKEKAKALLTDGEYRDELLSKGPALADELTWCAIWNAVKRETKEKHDGLDIKSEPFLMLAGARFTEVITKTQVYDSILARSANMRSKTGMMSMVTAFMAEPTTSINMLEDALRKSKRGYKGLAARAFASVAASVILNNALVALVYGMRDDDEDETFAEKYMQAFVSGMLDDVNLVTYYPYLKDLWSVLQGYDVERSDMSLVSDFTDAMKKMVKAYTSEDGDVVGAWWDMAGAVANIGGIPMQNIRRDVNGAINFFNTLSEDVNGRATTLGSMGDALEVALRDTLPVVGWLPGESKADKLYDAIMSGDKSYVNRLKGSYKDENAYHNAVRTALRENDPRIKEAAIAGFNGDPSERVRIARLIIKDGFAQDDVVAAINAEINKMKPDDESTGTKTKGIYSAEDFALEIANGDHASANAVKSDCIRTLQKNGETTENAEKSFRNSAKDELKDLYLDGKISADKVINALVTYCGFEREDAVGDIQYWDFKRDYPELFADDAWIDEYYEEVESSGIGLRAFVEYRNKVKGIEGADKKERRMDIIHSMPLTSEQKDALYLAEGWAESKLWQAPWH